MTYIDVHILQTVPPSNINRDDTGSPKTAMFGGVRRARVSSQAWKRATRTYFNQQLDPSGLGYRTKRIVELVAEAIQSNGVEDAQLAELRAEEVLRAAKITLNRPKKKASKDVEQDAPEPTSSQSDYLLFISAGQVSKLAQVAVSAHNEGRVVTKGEAQAAFNADHSIDVALFGRMVADDAELNVDAAAQVAHALGVSAVDSEFDYFTAIDDLQAKDHQTGAGMIGTVEFNSSTLYRYATVNVDGLQTNLGDPTATARAAATFVEAFIRSMPTGKQNTFANRTLPDASIVIVRDDQPVNLVGAFEEPVALTKLGSIRNQAAQRLARFSQEIDAVYGGPREVWLSAPDSLAEEFAGFGTRLSLPDLLSAVTTTVGGSLRPLQ